MRKILNYIILLSGIVLYGSIWLHSNNATVNTKKDIEKISESLSKELNFITEYISKTAENLDKEKDDIKIFDKVLSAKQELEKHKCKLFVYSGDSLLAWTDNDVIQSKKIDSILFSGSLFKLGSKYLLSKYIKTKNRIYIVLFNVKNNYYIENDYLENNFNPLLNIPEQYDLAKKTNNNKLAVKYKNKEVFYLKYTNKHIKSANTTFYNFLFFISLFLLAVGASMLFNPKNRKTILSAISIIILFFSYFLQPRVISESDLFSPFHYANSQYIQSLGQFLILVLALFFVAFLILSLNKKNKISYILSAFYLNAIYILFFVLIKSLVLNSNFNYHLYDLMHLSRFSFVFYLSVFILSISFLVAIFLFTSLFKNYSNQKFIIYSLLSSLPVFLYFILFNFKIEYIFFYVFILAIFRYSNVSEIIKIKDSVLIMIVLATSLFLSVKINSFTSIKEKKQREFFALGISSNRDFVAESQLNELENKIKKDTKLKKLVQNPIDNTAKIYNYINTNFFHSYWSKYRAQITICGTQYDYENENYLNNCKNYFDELVKDYGQDISNTNFKYLDYKDGKIHYINTFLYPVDNDVDTVSVTIELISKLNNNKLGFPKLLISKKSYDKNLNYNYSYAKYNNGKLIYETGDYFYTLKLELTDEIEKNNKTFSFFDKNGYNHLVYKNGNNVTLISLKHLSVFNYLATFSYLFLFFIVIIWVIIFFISPQKIKGIFKLNLKNTIQLSMLGILFFSLITIAFATVYLNINQTKKTHFNEISEKTQSILIELQNKFPETDTISKSDYDYISYLFEKWSYVFFTDINLYDKNGLLVSSSRPGIINKKIIGPVMTPFAYNSLINKKESELISEQKIGKLSYTASYIPFLSYKNNVLGYLNLSYFSKQELISQEISQLIVTLINVYALLFLIASIIAYFVSEKITKPLSEIKQKFSELSLEKTNTPVNYSRNDEIGELVNEYNRVIAELEKSALLLARSERESAWREMAKQIAHEIKNPLTPMKLSIQFLIRSWKNNDEDFPEKLKKISSTLMEQIDALTKIANEFSDFARISKQETQLINIVEILKSVSLLFENNNNVDIKLNYISDQIFTKADKEQILRVFNNLIKNAIQAVPENKRANIEINILTNNKKVTISIKDNGTGIPNEILDKLFVPNFTTKTTGTGLGLAIVKKIIEQYKGEIHFDTNKNGTTFYVTLPISY